MATRLQPNPDRLWDLAQVRLFVNQARDRVGDAGWRFISNEMREALIDSTCLSVVAGSARGGIPCAAAHCLRFDMRTVAGLIDAEMVLRKPEP